MHTQIAGCGKRWHPAIFASAATDGSGRRPCRSPAYRRYAPADPSGRATPFPWQRLPVTQAKEAAAPRCVSGTPAVDFLLRQRMVPRRFAAGDQLRPLACIPELLLVYQPVAQDNLRLPQPLQRFDRDQLRNPQPRANDASPTGGACHRLFPAPAGLAGTRGVQARPAHLLQRMPAPTEP